MGLLPPSYSLFSSLALSVVTFAAMQIFKEWIAVEGNLLRLCLGGFAGSWLFVFLLTALGNLYSLLFPRNSHVNFFPEIIVLIFVAVVASAFVHRICASTCLIFSLIALYYLNKISQSAVSSSYPPTSTAVANNKTNNIKSPSTPKPSRKDKKTKQ